MKASNLPCAGHPQDQQDSSDLPSSSASPQVITELSPETGKPRFLCSICLLRYTQSQGAWRHIRTVHKPKKRCSLCEFEYVRPCDYNNHLEKTHLVVNPDFILGKAPSSRARAAILTEFELKPQQLPVSPPAIEEEPNYAGSQPCPPPSLAENRVTGVSQPTLPSEDYNSLKNSQFRLPSAHPGDSTATHSPSIPETATTPAHFSPGDENHGTIFPDDGSFGMMSLNGDFWPLFLYQITQGWMTTNEVIARHDSSRDK